MDCYSGTTHRSETGSWYWVILQNGEIHSSGGHFEAEWEAYEAMCKALAAVEANKTCQSRQ